MTDMLVKLYDEARKVNDKNLNTNGITIQRALAIDKQPICKFVADTFSDICAGWVDECAASLFRHSTSCFVAIQNKRIVGFCCYDGTAKDMIGPVGVDPEFRRMGIASALLEHCFAAMKEEGYAYAIIGWVSSESYYEKACGAIAIPDSFPGIYSRMTMHN